MKVLIIAGPYEADRIRKAAVSAGFETVAVEPGESLSGWITASRPDLIVMAPQIVNPDPQVALSKVRAVPRGRVPIFLVGEAADEPRMKGLADGFFVRPVSTADLVARARARVAGARVSTGENAIPSPVTDGTSADFARGGSSPKTGPKTGSMGSTGSSGPAGGGASGPHVNKPTLKPLVSKSDSPLPVAKSRQQPDPGALFVKLAESIDATLDAEIRDVARSVGALRPPGMTTPPGKRPPREELERTPMAPMTALAAAAIAQGAAEAGATAAKEAAEELADDTGQRTVEVPRDVFAKMINERTLTKAGAVPAAGLPAPIESGKTADNDVAALFGRVVIQRLTGRLLFRSGGVEKAIYFERGVPILASSSDAGDRMGEMLVRQGRLTDSQQQQGVKAMATSGRRMGATLAQLGIIKLSELPNLVRRHYEEIIYSVFAWEEGEWALSPERPSKDESVLLTDHPAALILEGLRRKYSAARLRRCLGGGGQIFRLPAAVGTSEILIRMSLYHDERQVVPLFDGVRTLDEVCALCDAPDEVVCGVAWALSVLGHLERVEARAEEELAAPEGEADGRDAAPAAAAPGDAASRERERARNREREAERQRERDRDRDIDRARVLSRYALVEEGDYFQVLGVPRAASLHEVRRAHEALMREFAPAALDSELATELGPELRAIRTVLDEALRVLGEPRLRERYQNRLPAAAPARRPDV